MNIPNKKNVRKFSLLFCIKSVCRATNLTTKFYIRLLQQFTMEKERKIEITQDLRIVSFGISLLCLFLIIIHAVFPQFSIDTTTVALIVILIFPWLLPYIKTAKLPGGIEITTREIQQLEEVTTRSAIGAIPAAMRAPIRGRKPPSMYLMLFKSDPNLALASLRLDIERKLRKIASSRELDVTRLPLRQILNILHAKEIIGSSEFASLDMIINVCNKAVHAEKVDSALALKILDIGELALQYLSTMER